jgi:DNA-binding LacI/PurR family transcriptional regulator
VSVTGFDDITLARYVQPPLTTVAVSKVDLADHAWDALLRQLQGTGQPGTDLLPAELIVRGSTGAAN